MRECRVCNIEKQLTEFPKLYKSSGGHKRKCKSCTNKEAKERVNKRKSDFEKGLFIQSNSKECSKCKINKPKGHFDNDFSKTSGLSAYCTSCKNENSVNNRNKNLDKKRAYDRALYQKNKKQIRAVKDARAKERRKTDPLFRLKKRLHSRIGEYYRKGGHRKKNTTQEIIGCTYEQFKIWLGEKEEQDWQLDHVIPISFAQTEEEILLLNHYSNFQWLPEIENKSKNNLRIDNINLERVLENHPNSEKLYKILLNINFDISDHIEDKIMTRDVTDYLKILDLVKKQQTVTYCLIKEF